MKKLAFILSCIMIMATLIPALGVSAADSAPISNAAELSAIASNPTGTYHLTADIDLGGAEIVGSLLAEFNGVLDGKGFAIHNFKFVYTEGTADAGLILKVGNTADATIKNLNIGKKDAPVSYTITALNKGKSYSSLAAVVGNNGDGTNVVLDNINIYADVKVSGVEGNDLKANFGGFVGYGAKKGTCVISNSTFNGKIDMASGFSGASYRNAAGFVASGNMPGNGLKITDCANYADITVGHSTKEARATGIIAYDGGGVVVANCVNYGKITVLDGADAKSDSQAAGIISDVNGANVTVTNCINAGEITASKRCAGIVAYTRKDTLTLEGCANYGVYTADAEKASASVADCKEGNVFVVNNFADKTGTSYPETAQPPVDNPVTGDCAMIFLAVAVVSVFGVALSAKRREN